MGALNAGYTPSALPEWAIPDALDLSKWKWEPPTLLSAREDKRQAQLQLAQHWLGQWLVPPPIREEAKQLQVEEATAAPALSTPLACLNAFQSLVEDSPFYDLLQAADGICLQLRDSAEPLADEALYVESLGDILAALDARFGHTPDALTLFAQLYSATVQRLSAMPADYRSNLDTRLFQGLLTQLLDLPVGDELCSLFESTMRFVPLRHCEAVATQAVAILDRIFTSWSETAAMTEISPAQIISISSALSMPNPSKTSIFKTAERLLLERTGPSDQLYRIRYAWLGVLARLGRLKTDWLLESVSTLFPDHSPAAAVSNMDLCRLLLQHWMVTSKIALDEEVTSLFECLSSPGDSTCVAALAHALYIYDSRWELKIVKLCSLLKRTGRISELPTWFAELAQHSVVQPRLLRKVAVDCGDYRVALSLHRLALDLYSRQPSVAPRRNLWPEDTWSNYLDRAVRDPATPIGDVWHLLRLAKVNDNTVQIAAKLAYQQAHSDNLSNSGTLRKVVECIRHLQKSEKGLPPRALVAAYHVVTRDLAAGEWGRTTRFEWWLGLVRQEYGAEKAQEFSNMLRSWRQLVLRAKIKEGEVEDENSVPEKERQGRIG